MIVTGGWTVAPVAWGAPPEAPVTEPASSVTSTSAVLNGEMNPGASAKTGWYFAYSAPGGSSCQEGFFVFGAEVEGQAVHVSGQAEGLQPATTYVFCAVALNPETGETSIGQELSFATLAVKPSIDGESDSNVTSSDVLLEAQVNPNNQQTAYRFVYATDEALSGAVSVPGTSVLPASYGDQAVSVDLEGRLTPDTTYYYRVVAENATGTTEGPVQSFTTTAPPLLTSGQAKEITRDAATITGTVDPAG